MHKRPALGLEFPAERVAESRQFFGVVREVGIEQDPPDSVLGAVDHRLASTHLLGLAHLPGLECQDGQPLDRPCVTRLDPDQVRELPALEFLQAKAAGQPGSERADNARLKIGGGQMCGGGTEAGDVVARSRQRQLRPPDRRVLGPVPECLLEPAGRVGEPAGEYGVIGPTQPHPIVLVVRMLEGALHGLDGHGRTVEQPEFLEHVRGGGRAAPGGAEDATDIVHPPLEPVQPAQGTLELIPIVLARRSDGQGADEGLLSRRVLARVDRIGGAEQRGARVGRAGRRDPGPCRHRRVAGQTSRLRIVGLPAPLQLALAEEQQDFTIIGPTIRQTREPFPRAPNNPASMSSRASASSRFRARRAARRCRSLPPRRASQWPAPTPPTRSAYPGDPTSSPRSCKSRDCSRPARAPAAAYPPLAIFPDTDRSRQVARGGRGDLVPMNLMVLPAPRAPPIRSWRPPRAALASHRRRVAVRALG